ncbi:hypothetical protein EO087_09070 [Dyella sp. M7H15-1]|uniref:hypothetical protein n=1 Tax=Dyella sp. M7H15-1 TaxID=2501295 RepID=UPI001004DE60|nr:hypothetical protein [Dyella sp. M7H15-1]QAU24122.1 hypothetical protein EO087_09070 [Dyella sp. M7H15-1]
MLVLVISLFPINVKSGSADGVMSDEYNYLISIANSDKDSNVNIREIKSKYDSFFLEYQNDARLEHLSSDDLELLYRSSNVAAFFTQNIRYVKYMRMDVDVLQRRGLAHDRHYLDLYESYISLRMFDEASELIKNHNLRYAEKIPHVIVSPKIKGSRAFIVDKERCGLKLQSVNINDGVKIVIVSHPLCHFSRNASDYIESNALLKNYFDQHAIWLVPPSRKIEFDLVREWSSNHQGGSTMLAYGREDWSMITSWDTPTFYFLKDGNVVDIVAGWPKEGNEAALWAALRKVGLHPLN